MIKFGERYYDEWLGNVYSVLLNDEHIGAVDYEEDENVVNVHIVSLIHGYKSYFKEVVYNLLDMFPGKKLVGSAAPSCSYCGEKEDWESLGATTRPDPDDDWFTLFELENN